VNQPSARHTAAYRAAARSLYAGDTEQPPTRSEIAQAIADAVEAALAVAPDRMWNEEVPPRCGQRLIIPAGRVGDINRVASEHVCDVFEGHLEDGVRHMPADGQVSWTNITDVRWEK
jgi:hypothetical protein